MTKVVFASLKPSGSGKPSSAVTTKRIKIPDGVSVIVHTVDADAESFANDMSYVFRKNVARARRQNRQLRDPGRRVPAED